MPALAHYRRVLAAVARVGHHHNSRRRGQAMLPGHSGEAPRRWPRQLYETGTEPDPRFTLANERTFLAWLRTALALMAGGVTVEALAAAPGNRIGPLWTIVAIMLMVTGILCSAGAFGRWYAAERALRTGKPLPSPRLGSVLGYGLAAVGLTACVLLLVGGA